MNFFISIFKEIKKTLFLSGHAELSKLKLQKTNELFEELMGIVEKIQKDQEIKKSC